MEAVRTVLGGQEHDVIGKALSDADVTAKDIDLIGVTYGPGLVGALLIGVAAAKARSTF